MKRLILFSLLISLVMINVHGQNPKRFFQEEKLMTVGTFYFPEHWPMEQWSRDFANMKKMGFEYVHMGEFSWAFLEPREGVYDFEWLDLAIKLAGENGLKVMLCTPTATTPAWMGIKYPEVYHMDENYQRGEHGSRQVNSNSNPVYREFSSKIIHELGKRYGKNPNIWGWQLDNEPEARADYSPSAQDAFRDWLKEKYGTIEELNRAWGAAFWSIVYNSFDEVRIHNANAIEWWGSNPHALLDFKRFTAWVQADFLDEQATILREYISEDQFITTNYAAIPWNANPQLTKNLDFPAYTAYPNGGSANLGKQGFRLGDPDKILMVNDFYRPMDGVTGIMELQPGQVNWGNPNALLYPGTVRMWLWQCFGAGNSFASSYRFRQILYGVEQYHAGIMKNDGVTPARGGEDYVKFMNEIKHLEQINTGKGVPERYEKLLTAILWNHENFWDQNRQPQNANWSLTSHVMKYHKALKSLGAPVDYISENDDFSRYNMLIVPAYQAVDSTLVQKWKDFAENGGDLIITTRTATKTRDGHFWEAGWGAPIYNLIGASIKNYDMLPNYQQAKVEMDGEGYDWNLWGELLQPGDETEVLATFADQFYKGTAAVVSHKVGYGSVTYIGVSTNSAEMEKKIIEERFQARGFETQDYPEGVIVNWNKGFWVAVNYNSEPRTINLPENATILIGDKQLPPAGVLVWKE